MLHKRAAAKLAIVDFSCHSSFRYLLLDGPLQANEPPTQIRDRRGRGGGGAGILKFEAC